MGRCEKDEGATNLHRWHWSKTGCDNEKGDANVLLATLTNTTAATVELLTLI